ncbi:conserved hypothetical protein [Theileria orientalis strain Shintoku]|uniref:Uncharacterized protein n=1 Tax=Theileria orientalis strain Shintoku TaxID=869250 RepID=J4DAY1_THEOR|nr:conserved hypothetical protein [Theileria orientalis strain Shintoku]BAM42250.1 conserved hypothetical protein [Theileria orientalis strain Shintoku]|eukprot:XP_009692551.1 conserved hypothetical protein [Theileria orientalis strain Shintoku]
MARGSSHSGGATNQQAVPRWIWFLCSGLAFVGIVCLAISIFLPSWRQSGPITYNYIHKASKRQHMVEETKYGLHTVIYDNYMTKQSWAKRVSNVKAKGYMAIQNSSQNHRGGYKNFFVNECPAACRDGISARIRVYENLLGYNNLVLGLGILLLALVVVEASAGFGLLWAIITGKHIHIIQTVWAVAGVACLGSTIYWNRVTHKTWLIAIRAQMIPFPYLSYCYTLALVAGVLFVIAAMLLFFSDRLGHWMMKRKMQSTLNEYAKGGKVDFGQLKMPFGEPSAPNIQAQNMGRPVMGPNVNPDSGFNPGSFFNGMGFNNHSAPNHNESNSPSMWARNFQL